MGAGVSYSLCHRKGLLTDSDGFKHWVVSGRWWEPNQAAKILKLDVSRAKAVSIGRGQTASRLFLEL